MDTRFDPASAEPRLYEKWERSGVFHADAGSGREPFSVVIPPPNVTGALHIGHALNDTLQDIVTRARRMQGREACWLPGTDHAGIATQVKVEKHLLEQGTSKEALGRERFLEEVWAWKEKHGGIILSQLRRLGCSLDWPRLRFTMDDGLSRSVREAFVRLYRDGLVYRGGRIINWCPRCRTALSDDETEHRDLDGTMTSIRYPPAEGAGEGLVVATTRPETMLGDTAVAVHPEDPRYTAWIGKTLRLPIAGREIPVVADDAVDPDFGTGAVKVTPAHDPNDFEIGRRHDLPAVNVLRPDATMSDEAGVFAGLDRFEARKRVVKQLETEGLLVEQKPHRHAVGHCYRCGSVLEPWLSDQWFVRMKPLAARAIEAQREGRIRFFPARWEKVYLQWLENVRDWCISRQLWWGHRIPVWFCEEHHHPNCALEAPAACSACGSTRLQQDPDVLDTWFSSDLWPFSTFGWPEKTPALAAFYPTSVLMTAREIIYLWVARMVMMGLYFLDDVPFRDVHIHGLIRDAEGRKMSKSIGNVIDPIAMIDRYGADAVRLSLVLTTVEGQDIRFPAEKFEAGRNFTTKLWNAARMALPHLDGAPSLDDARARGLLAMEDRWILSRLQHVVEETTRGIEVYHFFDTGHLLTQFTWNTLCDWYLEIVKPRLREEGDRGAGARATLREVFSTLLRVLHPFVPFVTEELWERLGYAAAAGKRTGGAAAGPSAAAESQPARAELLAAAPWPQADPSLRDPAVEEEMAAIQDVVRAARAARNRLGLPERQEVDVRVRTPDEPAAAALRARESILVTTGRFSSFAAGTSIEKQAGYGVEVVRGLDIYVGGEGLEAAREAQREALTRKLDKARARLLGVERKLANESFTAKAPPAVVDRERLHGEALRKDIESLKTHLQGLGG